MGAPTGDGGGLVLVGGEALYDLWAQDDGGLRGRPGGGPFNAARTIARLGRPVAYLGRLSRDRPGRTLEALLARDGVSLEAVVRTDDPTTLAFADLQDGAAASWSFYDHGTAAPGLEPGEALAILPAAVDVLHVGTLGLALEPVAAAMEAVVAHLRGRALVVVDPNCRPWAVRDEAAYRARLGRVLSGADVVKVSDEDLAWLDPGRPAADAARALLDAGPAVVLLTRGAQGALVLTPGAEHAVAAPLVEVVDTIGAGDAFGGGFVAWWHARGLGAGALADPGAVVQATTFAARVAALTCARAGADPPRLGEVEDALGPPGR
ncbi:PfkB family carbohydrate kinase [Baekduia soli]|uniref:PfkB family carbohydrate kinase n=1 Tax=Baekduia soli TaxID=496014 RepID=UPI00165271BA|nr:PfkB family carbohydrate kinase [Baekduia soli]